MEHLGGTFKVNSARVVRAVKEPVSQTAPRRLSEAKTIKIRARNLAKLRLLHKN
jgi:hypothetical protein